MRHALMLTLALAFGASGALAQVAPSPYTTTFGVTPAPFGPLRYRTVRRPVALPTATPQTIPFDAKLKPPRVPGSPLTATAADPGMRLRTRLENRTGKRIGSSLAQRMGGGTPGVANDGFVDPRDRLESKFTNYDQPR